MDVTVIKNGLIANSESLVLATLLEGMWDRAL